MWFIYRKNDSDSGHNDNDFVPFLWLQNASKATSKGMHQRKMERKLRFGEFQYLTKWVVHFELLFVNSILCSATFRWHLQLYLCCISIVPPCSSDSAGGCTRRGRSSSAPCSGTPPPGCRGPPSPPRTRSDPCQPVGNLELQNKFKQVKPDVIKPRD